ncbi:MAG: TOBE domain-containing protein [Bauldia sp.]
MTHGQIEAMTLATTIMVMKDGVVQQVGGPEAIYDSPANVFVAGFMGSPPMNLIPAVVEQQDDRSLLVFGSGREPAVRLALRNPVPKDKLQSGRRVIFGIRPEAIGLGDQRPAGLDAGLVVLATEKTGSDLFVVSGLGGTSLTARLPVEMRVDEGDTIRLSFDPAKAACFDPDDGRLIHRFA